MNESFSTADYFQYLGYPSGDQPYTAKDLRILSVYCRADTENLRGLLDTTPFEYIDDRFVVQIADFSTATCGAFYDAGVIIPVRYKDHVGANYLFEYEDQPWSVAFGREVWGYPKQYAEIELLATERRVSGRVRRGTTPIFKASLEPVEGYSDAPWADLPMYPHIQVHALPEANRRSFKVFEIVARDTSADFVLHNKVFGPANLELTRELSVNGVTLDVLDVLGGEYSIGDYACTIQNGISTVLDTLV